MRKPRCSPPASPPSVSARRCSSPPPGRAPTTLRSTDPIGDFSDGVFLRSRDGAIVLFPGGRLQIDSAFFRQQTPKSGAFVRRARVELRGWLGPLFYFDVSGDFAPAPAAGTDVAPSALPAADEYLTFAPFGDQLMVQAGQFDVPFTLENRTSDAYTDFIERAMVARSLGAPRNKEVGVMAHGLLGDGRFYYSAGLFNGEGPEFRNIDNQSDTIGRLVATPFARQRPLVEPLVDRRLFLVRQPRPRSRRRPCRRRRAGWSSSSRTGPAARRRRGPSSCTSRGPSPPSAAS